MLEPINQTHSNDIADIPLKIENVKPLPKVEDPKKFKIKFPMSVEDCKIHLGKYLLEEEKKEL